VFVPAIFIRIPGVHVSQDKHLWTRWHSYSTPAPPNSYLSSTWHCHFQFFNQFALSQTWPTIARCFGSVIQQFLRLSCSQISGRQPVRGN